MVNARVMFQADGLLVLDELTSEVERLVVQNVLSANPVTHRMFALRSTQKVSSCRTVRSLTSEPMKSSFGGRGFTRNLSRRNVRSRHIKGRDQHGHAF